LRPLSRAGYRPLLEAGVRVFEWNGTMLHAKTAVADSKWGRVGSTNLNVASWFGNLELDVVIEDEFFARQMDQMYLKDLENATEIVLDSQLKIRAPNEPAHPHPLMTSGGGSAGRAAAGALRISNTVGAAFTNRRVLEPVEARIMLTAGSLLLLLAILVALFPRVFVYPLVVVFVWIALALLYRGYRLSRAKIHQGLVDKAKADAVKEEQG
jgi:cardiolipin synthase